MPRRIKLQEHLSVQEMEGRYRKAKDAIERSQWQIIWLLAQGNSSAVVRQTTGYSLNWIRTIAARYNSEGPNGIGDGRHRNPGQKRLLNGAQEEALKGELMKAETEGNPWNSVQVAAWMSQVLGRKVPQARGWEVLQRFNFKRKVPRPRHAKASPADQAEFKKT